jgi:hypothetical protein
VIVSGVVEGPVDDAVVRRLIADAGHDVGPIHVKNGKPALLAKLAGYDAAARIAPWLVLVDLNGDGACAAEFIERNLPAPARHMLFRVAVRQVESWLLADIGNFSQFLHVSVGRIPGDPDALPNAKLGVVDIARRSRSRSLRDELIPRTGSGRQVGPGYAARMIQFVERSWDPQVAAERSDSLCRCMASLQGIG